jgi:hypothetical protein
MKCLHALSFVPVLLAALASPALGQDAAPSYPQEPPGAYFIFAGGSSFNQDFDNPSAAFGGEYGDRLHRDVFAYASLMWIENLMSQQMRDYLVTGSEILGEEVRGRDRGMAFTVGATYSLPVNRRLRPFFGGGFGFVNLRRDIQSPSRGSFARTFPELTGLNDGIIEPGTLSSNKPLGELMVGYGGQFGRNGYFDVRYRYDRVFDVLENIDFSQVTASIGFSF